MVVKSRTVYWRGEISAAHKLNLPYESKCENIHGHNYDVEIWIEPQQQLNSHGMVTDFSDIKELAMKYDHTNLNEVMNENPTVENLTEQMAVEIEKEIDKKVEVIVRIWEDNNSYAETVVVTDEN